MGKDPWRRHPMADHTELVPTSILEHIHLLTSGVQQARKEEEQGYVRKIAKSVRKHGVRNPIRLGKNERGEPRIVDGEHRLAVGNLLAMPELPAYYHDPVTQDIGRPTRKLSQFFGDGRKQGAMSKGGGLWLQKAKAKGDPLLAAPARATQGHEDARKVSQMKLMKLHREAHAGAGATSQTYHDHLHYSLKRFGKNVGEHHAQIAANAVRPPTVKVKEQKPGMPETIRTAKPGALVHVAHQTYLPVSATKQATHPVRSAGVPKVGVDPSVPHTPSAPVVHAQPGAGPKNPMGEPKGKVNYKTRYKKLGKAFRRSFGGILIKAFRPPKPGQKAPIPRQPWEMSCAEFCNPPEPQPHAGHRLVYAHTSDRDVADQRRNGVAGDMWARVNQGEPSSGTHLIISVPEYDDQVRYSGEGAHIQRPIPPNHIVGVDPAMANSQASDGPRRLSTYRNHPFAEAFHAAFIQDALDAGHKVPEHVRAAHPHVKRRNATGVR